MSDNAYSKKLEKTLEETGIKLPEQPVKTPELSSIGKGVTSVVDLDKTNFVPDFNADAVVMISNGSQCNLPESVFATIVNDVKEGDNIKISYVSKTEDGYHPRFFEVHKNNDATLGQELLSGQDQTVFVSKDDLSNLVWHFDSMATHIASQNYHPQVKVSFSYTSKAGADVTKSVVIAYNDAPAVDASTVISSMDHLGVDDKNGDFVVAYKVEVEDVKNIGKVKLSIHDPMLTTSEQPQEYHVIGEKGVYFGQNDPKALLSFVALDGYKPQNGAAKNYVKVGISACDAYGWGPKQVLHVPISE